MTSGCPAISNSTQFLLNCEQLTANSFFSIRTALNALLKDLKKSELAKDVDAVNIGGLITTLEKSQLDFEAITQEKVEKKAQLAVQVLASFVTPIRRKIFQILTLVDTLEEFESGLYKTVVCEINVLIDEYLTRIRQRATLSEKAAVVEEEPAAT